MKSFLYAGVLFGMTALALPAQTELFHYASFQPAPSLAVQGSASFVGARARLTSGLAGQRGAFWYPTKRYLQGGFETTFQFQLGAGAEGLAFVVQNNALPGLGDAGSGLGYRGLPNSLAIEFDALADADLTDFAGAHVSVQSRGTLPNSPASSNSIASVAAPALTDGHAHTARIRYAPGALDVFLDDLTTPALSAAVNLTNLFALENGQAWFGLVAANGAVDATEDVLNWSLLLSPSALTVSLMSPLEGGSFLTPAVIPLEATAAGPDAIVQVEFYQGAQLIAAATNAPYRFRWDTALPGGYTLTAVAIDSTGRRVPSQPVRLVVYPSDAPVGISFATAPSGTNVNLAVTDKAGVIPQRYWNNAPMLANGNGSLQNLRNGAGLITAMDVTYDFVLPGEDPTINPDLSPDHRLMRSYGANANGLGQANSTVTISQIPFSIYDVIIYTDGANGGADRVEQFRGPGNSVYVRDAAWTSFAGIYARAGSTNDAGTNTPAGNYVRFNSLTSSSFTLTNNARSSTDGSPLGAVNAIQIVPSIYDRNSPPFLTRGPYLQSGSQTAMTVRWRSNRPVDSRVQYGLSASNLNVTAYDPTETQEHTLVLSNLTAGTRYYYAVGTSTNNIVRGTNLFFWTFPATPKATRIWALGDSGTANANAAAVRDAFYTLNAGRYVDVWLMLGDNAYNAGTDAEYQAAVFNMYTNTLPQTSLWAALGNHETDQSHTPVATTPYLSIFTLPQNGESGGVASGTERYYSFDYANIHFVCLDSMTNLRTTNGPMANWIRADLDANTNEWTIVYFHHPPYTKGSHDSDSPNGADFELVEMRENIIPILESYGVDLVLSGHSHCYERSYLLQGHYGYSTNLLPSMILNGTSGNPVADENPGTYEKVAEGTVYVVDGCSGQATFGTLNHPAMFRSLLNLGSVIVDVETNHLVARFLRENGTVQDTFTLVKQPPAPGSVDPHLRVSAFTADDGTGAGRTLTLQWPTQLGSRYVVERASRLKPSDWTPVVAPMTASGSTLAWSCACDARTASAFFRVVTVQ